MNFIDLFSGAGGLSEGFIREGFNPIAHVEIDKAACYTLKTRTAYHYLLNNNKFHHYLEYLKREISREKLYSMVPSNLMSSVINMSIESKNNSKIFKTINKIRKNKNIDVIIGGPPCQAYSLIGRATSKESMISDSRNYLYIEYAKYLKKFKPKYFVFENVLGLLSAKTVNGDSYLNKVLSLFRSIGYTVEFNVLNASKFGVLQNRKRIILIGRKGKQKGFYPKFKEKVHNYTVKEIFSSLPEIQPGEGTSYITPYSGLKSKFLIKTHIQNGLDFTTHHIARPNNDRDKEIYKSVILKWNKSKERLNYDNLPEKLKTHKNTTSFKDRFKIVASDLKYSQTVVAHISKDGHYYIHPDLKQNRSITPREAARLQSFPDDFFFEGVTEKTNRTCAFKQIGNAVPPLMASAIASEINKRLY